MYTTFPKDRWTKIYSTNPIECLNGEIKRRKHVVGIFPKEAAIIRLVRAILPEQNNKWVLQRARYMTLETIAELSDNHRVARRGDLINLGKFGEVGDQAKFGTRGYWTGFAG
jgi:transposase-like protein